MSIQAPITVEDGWFAGEDKTLRFPVYDANGAVQNITGWTIQFKLEPAQGGTAVLTKSATLTDAANGICQVAIAAADTSFVTATTTYWYALSRTDAGSNSVLAHGPAVLQAR